MNLTPLLNAAIATGITMMLTAMAACSDKATESASAGPADAVARVGTEHLTLSELRRAMPASMTQTDSAAFADAYVRAWVTDRLISQVAVNHIDNLDEINRLTEEYRRQLILWSYRQRVVESDTTLAVTEADIRDYYDAHSSEMTLREPMIRGIYIKMESNSPTLPRVRKLYNSSNQNDIEELEKVGLHGAIHYDYFRSQWIPWERIVTKIPTEIPVSSLRKGFTLDYDSGGFTYLLSVSDVLPVGSRIPPEAAEPLIRETLEALRLTRIDAALRERLYREAREKSLL